MGNASNSRATIAMPMNIAPKSDGANTAIITSKMQVNGFLFIHSTMESIIANIKFIINLNFAIANKFVIARRALPDVAISFVIVIFRRSAFYAPPRHRR